MGLTIKTVASEKLKPGRYCDGNGLYLQVAPALTKSWMFRYTWNKKEQWMGLGSVSTWSLAEARERAREQRQLVNRGIDPVTARTVEKQKAFDEASRAKTFAEVVTAYFEENAKQWKSDKYRGAFLSTLRDYVLPVIGSLSVAAVDTGHVKECLKPIWETKTPTASRIRGHIEEVLSYAIAHKYRAGPNPARWADNLEHLLPAPSRISKRKHHEAMPYSELPEFMAKLSEQEGVAARALEFLILTASRTSEVIDATWNEFDLKAKSWTVPKERMKVKGAPEDHRVPLSDRALALLAALPREEGNPLVFIGPRKGKPIGDLMMSRKLKAITGNGYVPHGFRATFSTWANETTGYPRSLIEKSLAHKVGNEVEQAYNRGDMFDKRRKLMDAWARYASTPAAEGATIISLRSAS